jgi:Transposase DDE domain
MGRLGPTWPSHWIKGRLLIVRRRKQAPEYARKKRKQRASKKPKNVSEKALEAAPYFFVRTPLPTSGSRQQILERYRCRWQIERACKRMKSIMGLGHLPPAGSGKWPRLAVRKTLYQPTGRAHAGSCDKAFPLGLRIG